jgi:hypothetical protein
VELTSGLAEKKENNMSEYCLLMKEATNLGSPVEVQLFAEEADIIKVVEVFVFVKWMCGCFLFFYGPSRDFYTFYYCIASSDVDYESFVRRWGAGQCRPWSDGVDRQRT